MKTILVIDDNPITLKLIKEFLRQDFPDYNIQSALSGEKGLNLIQKTIPEVILLDIIMPHIDGYQICKIIKENYKLNSMILLISALNDIDSRIKGLNSGADAFLSQPVNHAELKAQVNVMLRIRNAERQLEEQNKLLSQNQITLKKINHCIEDTRENERKMIAEYLHDGLGQLLALASIKVSAFSTEEQPHLLKKKIDEIHSLLNQAISESKSIVYQLNPPILNELGINEALKWKIQQIPKHSPFKIHFHSNCSPKIPESTSLYIYRSTCELLNNAIKHSDATIIKISLTQHTAISLSVSDNGKGIKNTENLFSNTSHGWGLLSIRERTEEIGGKLKVTSSNKGTEITISNIPVKL